MGLFSKKKRPTTFGSFTARTGRDNEGVFQQDVMSFGRATMFPLTSKTTTIAGRGPLMDQRNEGIVAGLDGMLPPSSAAVGNPQPGGKRNAGSGGAGSFATVTAKGAKG